MANMSYCRFHNTRLDVNDCLEALDNEDELSRDEYRACVNMFGEIVEWLESEGVIEINEDEYDEWIENLKRLCEDI